MRNTLRFPRWSRFRLWPVGKSAQAISLFLLVSSGLVTCEASGPPYRHDSPGTAAPIVGAYRFQPPLQFYARNQRGAVYFEPGRGREPRTYFYLRMLGMDNQGALRVRQYEGLAQITAQGQRLELRSERCYIFGKRLWIDRMSPLARWDCSHLVFDYEWPPAPDGSLRPIFPSGPHELQRDWFSPVALVPMPVSEFTHNPEPANPTTPAHQTPPEGSTYGTGIHFAGQIILLTPENRDQSARAGFERTDKRAETGVNASPDPADLRGMSAEERERFHREQAERVADMRELQQADAIVWG
ncbi:MAG: hypothetical protein KDK34_04860, partial [Leptospiraceae bacterium]|nr:hypothetical protein [Leptospiraceae bacterium]